MGSQESWHGFDLRCYRRGRCLLIFFVLLALPLSATTYYVDNCVTVGSDSNKGTSTSTPWLTLRHVNAQTFNPGDSILFQRTCTWVGQLVPRSSGSEGLPITFGAYGSGAQPVLSGASVVSGWSLYSGSIYEATVAWSTYTSELFQDGTSLAVETSTAGMVAGSYYKTGTTIYVWTTDGSNPTGHVIEASEYPTSENDGVVSIRSQSYITIDNLDIQMTNWYGVYFQVASHVTIQNSSFYHTYQNSISPNELRTYANSSYINTLNNTFSHCGISRTRTPGEEGVAANYLGIQNGVISGNTVNYQYGEGLSVNGGASNITISDNLVTNNPITAIYVDSGYGLGGDTTNITVQYNYVSDSVVSYAIATESSGNNNINGVNFSYNISQGGSNCTYALRLQGSGGNGVFENVAVYNNTLTGCTDAIVANGPSGTNNTFSNNILKPSRYYAWVQSDTATSNYSISYEDAYTPYSKVISWLGSYYTLAAFTTAFPDFFQKSVESNPKLTNNAGGNFTLMAGSPAIGAGTNLGSTYEMGLNPSSSWPSSVATLPQSQNGAGWEIGAFVFVQPISPAPPTSLSATVTVR